MKVEKVRVSLGSASVLGLVPQKFKVLPSTCYIMTYISGKCSANCSFCPQSRSSKSTSNKLSRVTWPEFHFKQFLTKLSYLKPSERFKRICIQTLNYPNFFNDLVYIVKSIKDKVRIDISIAIPPISKDKLHELKSLGVERVGIALDAASKEIFRKVKGDLVKGFYKWEDHFNGLNEALKIFPNGVSTHIIIGLGESQEDVINLLIKLKKLNILPSLFAFTPIKGTQLEYEAKPTIEDYRKLQLSRYLIFEDNRSLDDFTFNSKGKIVNINICKSNLYSIIEKSKPFQTLGCPNCDRPFYTSSPSGPFYNFPRKLNKDAREEIYSNLVRIVNF
ncbi:MAG: radical SAM protein [Promethearchaeota archaeon]|nr:MAG: radical SAM protein [Candidatus Lokiarchaeota archaeon]